MDILYFMHLCVVSIYHIWQFQARAQVCAAERASTEEHSVHTRVWKRIWETYNKKLAVLDKLHLLHSLPKQTKKTALTNLLAMTSESLDRRMFLLAKQGEAAILQRERGTLGCHQVTPSREKRNNREQGMHGGIISQCIPRSPGLLQQRRCSACVLEAVKKRIQLCSLLCSRRSLPSPPAPFSVWSPSEHQELIETYQGS